MSKKSCSICKVPFQRQDDDMSVIDTDLQIFQVPKQAQHRKVWSNICGKMLRSSDVVCTKHFEDEDFIENDVGKTHLKPDAKPTLQLNGVKTKKKIVMTDDFLDYQIKIEPTENFFGDEDVGQKPSLINEQLFDENGIAEERVSTDSGSSKNLITCGRVQFKANDTNYFLLSCIHCSTQYTLDEWHNFVLHIKEEKHSKGEQHSSEIEMTIKNKSRINDGEKDFDNFDDDNDNTTSFIDEEDKIINVIEDNATTIRSDAQDAPESNGVQRSKRKRKLFDFKKEHSNNTNDESSIRGGCDYGDMDGIQECSESQDELYEDEIYEPRIQHTKSKEKKQDTNNSSTSKPLKVNIDQISFDTSETPIVKDFLRAIKEFPILWHGRLSAKKMFDVAMQELVRQFNQKHKLSFTAQALTSSLTRMKSMAKRPSFATKYSQYQELWNEIKEAGQNITHNCDKCHDFFFTAIDLQIHKAKLHRIGELPFKCDKCKFGFSDPQKLLEHEKRHSKTKSFVCEICQKAFLYEFLLKTHAASHASIVCEICGETFSRIRYKKHKMKHDSPKEKCEVCGKAYYDKWLLSEHMKSHLNQRNYKCDLCGTTFNQQQGLRIHLRNVHQTVKAKPRFIWVSSKAVANDDNNGQQQKLPNQNRVKIKEAPINCDGNESCSDNTTMIDVMRRHNDVNVESVTNSKLENHLIKQTTVLARSETESYVSSSTSCLPQDILNMMQNYNT